MRVDISRWSRFMVLGCVVSAIATTGCSSGWKMPSMKMPWSKKPSESALAGSGPSSLTYPTSPASKQTPNAIASAAAGKPAATGTTTPPANLMAQGSSDRTAGTPSYSAPSATASSTPGYKPPAAGAAAGMNGYATGPYNTFGQTGAANSLAAAGAPARPATPSAAAAVPGMAAGYAASNPYAPPAGQGVGLPSSQAYGSGVASNGVYGGRPSVTPAIAAAPGMSAPSMGAPGMSTPGMTAPGMTAPGMSAPGSLAASTNTAPGGFASAAPNAFASTNPPSLPNAGQMNLPINNGTYNPVGSTAPSMSAPNAFAQSAPPNPGMNAGFAMPSSQPNFAPASGAVSVPAQTASYSMGSPNNAATASYRPGSTSRPTGYNFAQQGAPAGQGNAPVAGSQPNFTSTPYTANGASNPGYSLPPSSTLNR